MKIIRYLVVLALVAGLGMAVGIYVEKHGQPKGELPTYTCGMHPEVIRHEPGVCPICGMKLTLVHGPGAGAHDSSVIAIDPVTMQNMGLRTALVTKGPLKRSIRTVSVIDFNETTLVDVTTKIKGWIEKLYVDSTGQQVHKGDPLFEIYSPELYSAQTEYLLVLNQFTNASAPGAEALKSSVRTKLKYYDISDGQIADLEKSREAKKTLPVNAPRDGIVVEKLAVEGQMVDAGMKLYRLADLGIVWVQAQIYEQDLAFVQLGQEATVTLSYLPDRKFRGRVTYIYPTVDDKTRTAKVRMEFHNPGYFMKPGMFATVELETQLEASSVLVPDAAVLRSGEQNTVFVALDGGKFEPRSVTLGPRSTDNNYQVLNGLKEGERVVTSGQFMLDSESQLREAIQKMNAPVAAGGTMVASTPQSAPTTGVGTNVAPARPMVYICPMPEHVAIQYEHAGNCPICGMMLIPVAPETLAKLQPGGEVDYYTCPMSDSCPTPEHGQVKYDKPGKCPVCGMTLIPISKAAPVTKPAEAASGALPAILYTCAMHPDVISDKPGACPKCGMTLVETSKVPESKAAEAKWRAEHPGPVK